MNQIQKGWNLIRINNIHVGTMHILKSIILKVSDIPNIIKSNQHLDKVKLLVDISSIINFTILIH